MSEHRLSIKPGYIWHDGDDNEHDRPLDVKCPLRADHWSLNEVWTKHLKPQMALIAQPLLSSTVHQLEDMHQDLMAWDKASREWDPVSYSRSAIEPHDQDRHREAIDILIDAARDALEWLAFNSPPLFETWSELLAASDVPILRRMATHAVTVHPRMSADERLFWLLDRVGLHDFSAHHEVYRAVALSYTAAGEAARQSVLNDVLEHKLPASGDWSAEIRTVRSHFDWLSWLLQAKPDCVLVKAALAPIEVQYPEMQPSDHPDFTHWCGSAHWLGIQSPRSVEQLLAQAPCEQLDELLTFKGSCFEGPDRDGLLATVKEASKLQSHWGIALVEVLAERSLWSSDLLPAVIRGWQEAVLTIDDWCTVLETTARPELHTAHAYDVANLLYAIVRDGGKPFALDLLEQANAIALLVWQALDPNERDENIDDWLSRAINRPAGIIVEFWINGLSLHLRGKSGPERTLPDTYRQWFTMVVQDPTSKGGLGRSVLASQTAFLFGLDEAWTRQHVIPLFSHGDRHRLAQAWDGFLMWGRLYPALVEALMPAFVGAIDRLNANLPDRRRRFIEFYTALAVFHVDDPTRELLPPLFQYGSLEDRISFASHLGHILRQMQPAAKQELWDRWLFRYWQSRQQAVPAALDDAEIRKMLEWLPHVGDAFPAAVSLAVRAPTIRIEYCHLLSELRESDMVTRYPSETAGMLIYLCNCVVVGYQTADLGIVAARLPVLEPNLRRRLDEGLARAGAR